jgi:hypothetical protein
MPSTWLPQSQQVVTFSVRVMIGLCSAPAASACCDACSVPRPDREGVSVMTSVLRPIDEINREAISALYRELGVADTIRFLQQFSFGHGDSVERHRDFQSGTSVEALAEEIRRWNTEGSERSTAGG